MFERSISNNIVSSSVRNLFIRFASRNDNQKSCDCSNKKYHIFCSYGGSGSSFLTKKLDAFVRPDVWQPTFNGQMLIEWKSVAKYPDHGELLDIRGYDAVDVNWEPFNRRTKNKFKKFIDSEKSIEKNLIQFCHWIQQTEHRVLFAHAGIMNFFNKNNISDVTYLVRHPLHAYVSFAKPERHKAQIEALGGIESTRAIEYWADRWNRHLEDYLKCKDKGLNPILIRFEYAKRDSQIATYHEQVFNDFATSKRNSKALSDRGEGLLKSLVSNNYFKIYEKWDL